MIPHLHETHTHVYAAQSDFDNGDDASASTASGNGESADGWDTSVYPSTVGEHLSGSPEDSPGQVCASDLSSASTKRTNDGTRDPRKKSQKEVGSAKDHFSRLQGPSKARAAKAGSKAHSDEAMAVEQKDDNEKIREDNDAMEDGGQRSSHTSKKSASRSVPSDASKRFHLLVPPSLAPMQCPNLPLLCACPPPPSFNLSFRSVASF